MITGYAETAIHSTSMPTSLGKPETSTVNLAGGEFTKQDYKPHQSKYEKTFMSSKTDAKKMMGKHWTKYIRNLSRYFQDKLKKDLPL